MQLPKLNGETPPRVLPAPVMALIYAAVFYNAVLAVLNTAGLHQSFASVAATEMTLLAAAAAYVVGSDLSVISRQAVHIVVLGVALTVYVSYASQKLVVDCARNTAIVGLFTILGYQTNQTQVLRFFRWTSVLVLLFLIFELVATDQYANLFQPASYYANTRGIEEFSLDDSGLFRNALGFQGRFSFGLSSHRTASLFLEQVSLANFAGVLCIYILSTYDRLPNSDRLIHIVLILLIVLTNDSRTTSSLIVVSFIGYFAYPFLDYFLCLAIMPMVLGMGYLFMRQVDGPVGDDFSGRLSTTMQHLTSFDAASYLGFGAQTLPGLMDSGYAYVIAGSTIFGFVLLWLFLSSVVPFDTAARRRCLFGLNVYMFANLMIGGTAVFSIKVAAPLWYLVGFMASRACDAPVGTPRDRYAVERPNSAVSV